MVCGWLLGWENKMGRNKGNDFEHDSESEPEWSCLCINLIDYYTCPCACFGFMVITSLY